MNKYFRFLLLFCIFINVSSANAGIFQGFATKDGLNNSNKIVDSKTKNPISRAKIVLPQKGFKTYTDSDGKFNLNTNIDGQTIMSVEKPGYKPFSMTVDQNALSKPIIVGIEKSKAHDIKIESDMIHLGDNNFSELSANASDFQVKSVGPFFSKKIKMDSVSDNEYLVIGSIIGIDTEMAKKMGQNKIISSFASPPEVFFNGNKIADIQINRDGQRINLPVGLIKPGTMNVVTVKTGRTLMQTAYTD